MNRIIDLVKEQPEFKLKLSKPRPQLLATNTHYLPL